MNLQNATNIVKLSADAEGYDFEDLIKRLYPGQEDWASIIVSQMTLAEFVFLSKKVFTNFQQVFSDRQNSILFPMYYAHPQHGQSHIENQISSYINYLNSRNIAAAEAILEWLIGYQLQFGIFKKNRQAHKDKFPDSISLLVEKLSLLEGNIKNQQESTKTLFESLTLGKKELESFISQKKEELNQISVNLASSNSQVNQIAELLNMATASKTKLDAILEKQVSQETAFDKKIKEFEAIYKETNSELDSKVDAMNEHVDNFNNLEKDFQEKLKFVESKKDFFEERIKYLEELIGREVGASLFETFKQRKLELNNPILFWRWAVPVMTLLTIGWIFFLFHNQNLIADIQLWWQAFAINSIKTIPVIFLLLFSISQYRKERKFQEEYAFKSAVALTIDAYSNRISDPANKDKLIVDAVLSLYKSPIEEVIPEKLKSPSAIEAIKTLAETTKELVKSK